MKSMAEVLAEHQFMHHSFDGVTQNRYLVCSCGARPLAWDHPAHQADALTAAGYGPVNAVAVVHVAHDTEAHARSFNEGYETAMAQELADDPTTAQDWLDEKLKAAGAAALRDAAEDFEDNMGVGEFDEWARRDGGRWTHIEEAWEHQGPYMDWLRARAEALDTP